MDKLRTMRINTYEVTFSIIFFLIFCFIIVIGISKMDISGKKYYIRASSSNVADLYKDILNRSMPIIEISYFKQGYVNDSFDILGNLLEFSFNINFKNPKSFFKTELPVLLSYNESYVFSHEEDDKSTDDNFVPPEAPSTYPNVINGEPLVLIYHTHTSESYIATEKFRYIPTDPDRTEDQRYNIVRVGEEIAKELSTKYGVNVIQDKTVHDYPSYQGSYSRSYATVKKYLEKYSSIKVILDIHRDAYGNTVMQKGVDSIPVLSNLNPYYRNEVVTTINGEKVARVMWVVGTYRKEGVKQDWHKNYEFALELHNKMNQLYPNMSRKVITKPYYSYNQEFSDYSVLIEVGSNYSTLEEALNSSKYIARVLAEVINEDLKNNKR